MAKLNAWGEPIEDEKPTDPHWVPEDERQDEDDIESVALGTTGDDMPLINAERQAYLRAQDDQSQADEEE